MDYNPVYPKENGQNNYALIEELAVPYDMCLPPWNNEYSQAAHELKEDISEGQKSQPVINKTPFKYWRSSLHTYLLFLFLRKSGVKSKETGRDLGDK